VNERQAEALTRAAEALRCAAASAAGRLPLDFWALDLRGALLALGEARAPACSPPGSLRLKESRGRGRLRQAAPKRVQFKGSLVRVCLLGARSKPYLINSHRHAAHCSYDVCGRQWRVRVCVRAGASRACSSLTQRAFLHSCECRFQRTARGQARRLRLRRAGDRRRGQRAGAGRGVLALLHRQVSRASECRREQVGVTASGREACICCRGGNSASCGTRRCTQTHVGMQRGVGASILRYLQA